MLTPIPDHDVAPVGVSLGELPACDAATCSVRTDEFDGPLELLLYLVRRQGVTVQELRIAPITDAYLAQLALFQELDLDLAGDFLVMAATLCLLKSRDLLPRAVTDDEDAIEDEEDLREALIRRLVEYERYRDASQVLGSRVLLGRDVYPRPPTSVDLADRPLDPGVDAMGLLEVLYSVLQRSAEPEQVHEVALEAYSLREMAGWLLQRLAQGPRALSDLLAELDSRLDRVVAFLAALEMARLQLVDVQQSHHLAPVVLHPCLPPEDADLTALNGAFG